jgi:propanediol dehydratase large subunit
MSGSDRARIYDSVSDNGEIKAGDLYAETVIATSYDPETGERIFDESDKIALMEKSAQAIDILAKVGLRLSGMGTEAQDEAGKSFLEESATTVSV